jgi:hypothetical protein
MTTEETGFGQTALSISLDRRLFRPAAQAEGGEVSPGTVFWFRQRGDMVHAVYAGGTIRLGFLVGRREGGRLDFRYAQLNADGETSTGKSRDRIELLPTGILRLHETWQWESRDGSGISVLEEIAIRSTARSQEKS